MDLLAALWDLGISFTLSRSPPHISGLLSVTKYSKRPEETRDQRPETGRLYTSESGSSETYHLVKTWGSGWGHLTVPMGKVDKGILISCPGLEWGKKGQRYSLLKTRTQVFLLCFTLLKCSHTNIFGTTETAQPLRAVAALPEDLGFGSQRRH